MDIEHQSRRPIMALLELLSRRWSLRVLWELREGARTSRQLREEIGISPTVLQARVNELREAGIVQRLDGGYGLTNLGLELGDAFAPLNSFSKRWAEARDASVGDSCLDLDQA